jgi:hypothetical protein
MDKIKKDANQSICESMTQIQKDIEDLFDKLIDQAGGNIKPEIKSEYTHEFENTKQVIEIFNGQYCPSNFKEK